MFLEGLGNSLVVQWLGLHSLNAKGPSSIPGQKLQFLCSQKKKFLEGLSPPKDSEEQAMSNVAESGALWRYGCVGQIYPCLCCYMNQ